jgi:pilus assembly protein Flp/PilA
MNKLLRLYVKLKCRLEGATAIEYALLVTLIAVVIAVTVGILGGRINIAFQKVVEVLPSA